MKFSSSDIELVKELFLPLEEIMSALESIDEDWKDIQFNDKTQMRDLNLSEEDFKFLEDTLGVKIKKKMLLVDLARKIKEQL